MSQSKKHAAKSGGAPNLGELRAEIDRIDEAMHNLLIERGEIIESLIAVKKTQESGAAFRPDREASMMRRLAERHRGILPIDTVESIWRVIISTFTFVQANYSVHADMSAGDALVRDSSRFHFGFTVPLVVHTGAAAVVNAVATSKGDLGLVPATVVAGGGAWWTALEGDKAPKIIARLPFVERSDHPASLPLFVVSKPLVADAAIAEVETWSVSVSNWSASMAAAISSLADVLVSTSDASGGASLLVSMPQGKHKAIVSMLDSAGSSMRSMVLVGGHANRYTVSPSK